MKFAGTVAAATAVATVGYFGYTNYDRFYDHRLGGWHWKQPYTSIVESIEGEDPQKPVTGLDCPVESHVLLIRDEEGNIVMAHTKRWNKDESIEGGGEWKEEWTCVGGKSESWKRDEDQMTDFSDLRFVHAGEKRKFTSEECADVVVENPRYSVAREVVEELTGLKEIDEKDWKTFDWLVQRIYNHGRWKMLKTNKQVKVDKGKDTEYKLGDFQTYMGVCRINLTKDEIATLNSQLEFYPEREQRELASKKWKIDESIKQGKDGKPDKTVKMFVVETGDDLNVRKYNANILFKFYWEEFQSLMTSE